MKKVIKYNKNIKECNKKNYNKKIVNKYENLYTIFLSII